jgi:nucleoside-diphosphate-sugar epimerase
MDGRLRQVRILVTVGAAYIGSHIAKELARSGYSPISNRGRIASRVRLYRGQANRGLVTGEL